MTSAAGTEGKNMSVKTALSTHRDPKACARELKNAIGDFDSRFVTFFASSKYDPEALGLALLKEFGSIPSLGCTTAGELGTRDRSDASVTLMAMDGDSIRSAEVELIGDLHREDATRRAIESLASSRGTSAAQLSPSKYLGMVVHDGLSKAEEAVMERITSLTNVPFVGGSAGDDLAFRRTFVFVNFRPHTAASAVALLEPTRQYGILKTQSFRVRDDIFEVTDVDEATRTVRSFNGRPAAKEFADRVGLPIDKLAENFRKYAVGFVTPEGEPYVRSAQRVLDGGLVFYCQLKLGTRLNLLEAEDIVLQTRRDLAAKIESMGGCQAILEFQCILRTLELDSQKQSGEYAKLFASIPTAAFSTYGESYVGHLNQTSTMLLFG